MSLQNLLKLRRTCVHNIVCKAFMSAQSKKDFEAIMTYNKLRKKPLTETTPSESELKQAQVFFNKVLEYRERSKARFEPSKLFMVWRIASLVGRPMWEKEAIINLGLQHHKVKYAIVKNTASNNQVLWSIKHLIRVKPITFPDGFPSEEDLYNTFLKQSGELVVDQRLKVLCEDLEEDSEYKEKTLDYRTVREDLRLNWNKGYPKLY